MSEALNKVEPLAPSLWFARFATVSDRAGKLADGSPEALLRHVFHLLVLTPGPLSELLAPRISEAEMETLLGHGMYADVVLSLVGPRVGYNISKGTGEDAVIACTVALAGGLSCRAESASLPAAFLMAFCGCIGRLRAAADEVVPALSSYPQMNLTDQCGRAAGLQTSARRLLDENRAS